ncbi:hypothetical protein CPB84DRAFT_1744204 [Gymnopilus junonius]|uniref:Uncharacterized protein n=1 Tax=Gymnopilus junonius TaxID=109634 RepID=A0A9P5TSD2_GYMJU|nr:hypothetical protein CPB84DRAFT_1744204 [Gymnopilus junonius]
MASTTTAREAHPFPTAVNFLEGGASTSAIPASEPSALFPSHPGSRSPHLPHPLDPEPESPPFPPLPSAPQVSQTAASTGDRKSLSGKYDYHNEYNHEHEHEQDHPHGRDRRRIERWLEQQCRFAPFESEDAGDDEEKGRGDGVLADEETILPVLVEKCSVSGLGSALTLALEGAGGSRAGISTALDDGAEEVRSPLWFAHRPQRLSAAAEEEGEGEGFNVDRADSPILGHAYACAPENRTSGDASRHAQEEAGGGILGFEEGQDPNADTDPGPDPSRFPGLVRNFVREGPLGADPGLLANAMAGEEPTGDTIPTMMMKTRDELLSALGDDIDKPLPPFPPLPELGSFSATGETTLNPTNPEKVEGHPYAGINNTLTTIKPPAPTPASASATTASSTPESSFTVPSAVSAPSLGLRGGFIRWSTAMTLSLSLPSPLSFGMGLATQSENPNPSPAWTASTASGTSTFTAQQQQQQQPQQQQEEVTIHTKEDPNPQATHTQLKYKHLNLKEKKKTHSPAPSYSSSYTSSSHTASSSSSARSTFQSGIRIGSGIGRWVSFRDSAFVRVCCFCFETFFGSLCVDVVICAWSWDWWSIGSGSERQRKVYLPLGPATASINNNSPSPPPPTVAAPTVAAYNHSRTSSSASWISSPGTGAGRKESRRLRIYELPWLWFLPLPHRHRHWEEARRRRRRPHLPVAVASAQSCIDNAVLSESSEEVVGAEEAEDAEESRAEEVLQASPSASVSAFQVEIPIARHTALVVAEPHVHAPTGTATATAAPAIGAGVGMYHLPTALLRASRSSSQLLLLDASNSQFQSHSNASSPVMAMTPTTPLVTSPLPPSAPPTRRQSRAVLRESCYYTGGAATAQGQGQGHTPSLSVSSSAASSSRSRSRAGSIALNGFAHPGSGAHAPSLSIASMASMGGGNLSVNVASSHVSSSSSYVRHAVYIDSEEVRERLHKLLASAGGAGDELEFERPWVYAASEEEEGEEAEEVTEEIEGVFIAPAPARAVTTTTASPSGTGTHGTVGNNGIIIQGQAQQERWDAHTHAHAQHQVLPRGLGARSRTPSALNLNLTTTTMDMDVDTDATSSTTTHTSHTYTCTTPAAPANTPATSVSFSAASTVPATPVSDSPSTSTCCGGGGGAPSITTSPSTSRATYNAPSGSSTGLLYENPHASSSQVYIGPIQQGQPGQGSFAFEDSDSFKNEFAAFPFAIALTFARAVTFENPFARRVKGEACDRAHVHVHVSDAVHVHVAQAADRTVAVRAVVCSSCDIDAGQLDFNPRATPPGRKPNRPPPAPPLDLGGVDVDMAASAVVPVVEVMMGDEHEERMRDMMLAVGPDADEQLGVDPVVSMASGGFVDVAAEMDGVEERMSFARGRGEDEEGDGYGYESGDDGFEVVTEMRRRPTRASVRGPVVPVEEVRRVSGADEARVGEESGSEEEITAEDIERMQFLRGLKLEDRLEMPDMPAPADLDKMLVEFPRAPASPERARPRLSESSQPEVHFAEDDTLMAGTPPHGSGLGIPGPSMSRWSLTSSTMDDSPPAVDGKEKNKKERERKRKSFVSFGTGKEKEKESGNLSPGWSEGEFGGGKDKEKKRGRLASFISRLSNVGSAPMAISSSSSGSMISGSEDLPPPVPSVPTLSLLLPSPQIIDGSKKKDKEKEALPPLPSDVPEPTTSQVYTLASPRSTPPSLRLDLSKTHSQTQKYMVERDDADVAGSVKGVWGSSAASTSSGSTKSASAKASKSVPGSPIDAAHARAAMDARAAMGMPSFSFSRSAKSKPKRLTPSRSQTTVPLPLGKSSSDGLVGSRPSISISTFKSVKEAEPSQQLARERSNSTAGSNGSSLARRPTLVKSASASLLRQVPAPPTMARAGSAAAPGAPAAMHLQTYPPQPETQYQRAQYQNQHQHQIQYQYRAPLVAGVDGNVPPTPSSLASTDIEEEEDEEEEIDPEMERMRREKAHEERWARVRMEADAQQAAVEAVHQQYIQPHTDSPLLERPRLKSMTSLGNLRSASASANALAQQSQVSPKPGKGFRGFVERMGLVGSSASNTPVSSYPGTPLTGSSPGPFQRPRQRGRLLIRQRLPLTAGNPISGGAHGPGLGSVTLGMRGAKGPKRKLIISGVGLEDVKGYEAVKTWCEKFGEIKEMTRAPNGSLYVDFKKASVAETVCRLQAQVNIRGVGSVTISWYTKKKPT